MKGIHNFILLIIVLISTAYSYVHVAYGLKETEIPPSTEALWLLAFALLTAMWIMKEPMQKDKSPVSGLGAIAFIAWPIVLPYHLIKTRGMEGFMQFLGFVWLYFAPFLSGLVAYAYYS